MPAESWRESEPGWNVAWRQALSLVRLGFESTALTLLGTLLCALLTVGAVVWLQPAHAPRFVLRVVEMDGDPNTSPRLKRELPEYVNRAVFTSDALLSVMRRHRVQPSLVERDPRTAIESFREDIVVDAYQNYFLEERAPGDVPRSVRIMVSYHSRDRLTAIAVTRDLGQLIVDHERRVRREQAAHAAREAAVALERATRGLSERRLEILEKQLAVQHATEADPVREVELVSLLGSLQLRQRQVDEARTRKTALDLGLAYERQGAGLSFDVADEGEIPRSSETGPGKLALYAAGAFAGLLPFVALAVGAFHTKRGVA